MAENSSGNHIQPQGQDSLPLYDLDAARVYLHSLAVVCLRGATATNPLETACAIAVVAKRVRSVTP